jgi:hypothetical protein
VLCTADAQVDKEGVEATKVKQKAAFRHFETMVVLDAG